MQNPVNGIVGAARALESSLLTAEQRQHLHTIQSCAAFVSALVDSAQELVDARSGAGGLRCEPYEPARVLADVGVILARPLSDARVELTIAIDPNVPRHVAGDAARVQQILINFVANAAKFAPAAPIGLHLRRDGDVLEFSVADRGPGIPEEEREKLFQEFSRLDAARQAGIPGRGLGLAISRALARRMGGDTSVRGRDGGGSIFVLTLPFVSASAVPPVAAPAFDFHGARALVVEDVDYNATALAFVLSSFGFTCDRARDATEALAVLAREAPAAVFVDCDLPGMLGPELVRAARQMNRGRRAPVFVATTAHASREMQDACLAAGMDAYVTKPITPRRIAEVLGAFSGALRSAPSVHLPRASVLREDILDFLGGDTAAGRRESRQRYVAVLRQTFGEIEIAARAGDRARICRSAHQLLGHARMVGAEPLAALAVALETSAPALSDAQLREQVDALRLPHEQLAAAVLQNETSAVA